MSGDAESLRAAVPHGSLIADPSQPTMDKRYKFSAWVFCGAGIYGVVALLPQYFLEEKLGRDFPPPLNHPEYFYGFLGVALAWQLVFLLIARDVERYRLLMLPAIVEKLSFGLAVVILHAQGRAATLVAVAGVIDLILALLFWLAFRASRNAERIPPNVDQALNP
jgi:hypothetical protein